MRKSHVLKVPNGCNASSPNVRDICGPRRGKRSSEGSNEGQDCPLDLLPSSSVGERAQRSAISPRRGSLALLLPLYLISTTCRCWCCKYDWLPFSSFKLGRNLISPVLFQASQNPDEEWRSQFLISKKTGKKVLSDGVKIPDQSLSFALSWWIYSADLNTKFFVLQSLLSRTYSPG